VNPKADNVPGSFLFGVMTGVLGLPCFGFVAGALIPAATTLGTTAIIVIFTALGVGMAAPYVVLSIFPKLVEKLPRTGPASELVKQVLGLLLIGFGLFFFGTGVRALIATHPYTAESLHIYALSAAVIAAGAWLLWRTLRITRKPLNIAVFGLIGAGVAFSGVALSVNSTISKRESYVTRQAAIEAAGPGNIIPGDWNEYSPALLDKALAEGKTVFIDFTADWCINCKVFEAQVLDKEPVRSLLRGDEIAMIKVDMTGKNPAGDRLLSDLGRVGIPTWAVMGPGLGDDAKVIQSYTPGAVIDALESAAGRAFAANPAGRANG
jgi:thiol:disulfide interchange protein